MKFGLLFFKKTFFLLCTIFKVSAVFVTTMFLFVFFFCHEAYGILAPWSGVETTPPSLDGKVLTTSPAGKSLIPLFWCELHSCSYSAFKLYVFLPHFPCDSRSISPRCSSSPVKQFLFGAWESIVIRYYNGDLTISRYKSPHFSEGQVWTNVTFSSRPKVSSCHREISGQDIFSQPPSLPVLWASSPVLPEIMTPGHLGPLIPLEAVRPSSEVFGFSASHEMPPWPWFLLALTFPKYQKATVCHSNQQSEKCNCLLEKILGNQATCALPLSSFYKTTQSIVGDTRSPSAGFSENEMGVGVTQSEIRFCHCVKAGTWMNLWIHLPHLWKWALRWYHSWKNGSFVSGR